MNAELTKRLEQALSGTRRSLTLDVAHVASSDLYAIALIAAANDWLVAKGASRFSSSLIGGGGKDSGWETVIFAHQHTALLATAVHPDLWTAEALCLCEAIEAIKEKE